MPGYVLYPVSKRRFKIIPIVLCTVRVRIPKAVEEYNILLQKRVCYDVMRNCPVDYGAVCNWSVRWVMVPCVIGRCGTLWCLA